MRLVAAVSVGWVIAVGGCAAPPAPPPQPWDGLYTGDVIATPVAGGTGACPDRRPNRDMIVANNYVNFGEFQGPVNLDGSAVLTAGRDTINGRFTATGFTGVLMNPPSGCTYQAVMRRSQ
jgi:hypothetical protein